LYILYAVIPWAIVNVPLSPTAYTSSSRDYFSIGVPYPPLATFQTSAFWAVLGHWGLPTLFIPAFFGTLISFRPSPPRSPSSPSIPNLPFDALTASIIQLAAHVAYPYGAIDEYLQGVDVLGWRWRVVAAGVGVAFAFAEAISGNLALAVTEDDEQDSQLQIEE